MPGKAEFKASFAICAAIIGAGFASGREIVGFFAGLGSASWLGVAAASAAISALTYMIMHLSVRTREESFPGLYGALMGESCREAVGLLNSLLCLITASAMLSAGAELGALTFPVRHSHALGFALTLCAALSMVFTGLHALSGLGALLVPLIAVYYLIMMLNGTYAADFSLHTLPAALPLGLMYASFNMALAGGTVCLSASGTASSPRAVSVLTGGIMFVLLALANGAMLRAGEAVRQMTIPSAALAARWGIHGYYLSIAVMWLSILTTLCAMLHTLSVQLRGWKLPRAVSLSVPAVAASLVSVCGFRLLVDSLYPILGWICGFALIALAAFLPDETEQRVQSSASSSLK